MYIVSHVDFDTRDIKKQYEADSFTNAVVTAVIYLIVLNVIENEPDDKEKARSILECNSEYEFQNQCIFIRKAE